MDDNVIDIMRLKVCMSGSSLDCMINITNRACTMYKICKYVYRI